MVAAPTVYRILDSSLSSSGDSDVSIRFGCVISRNSIHSRTSLLAVSLTFERKINVHCRPVLATKVNKLILQSI